MGCYCCDKDENDNYKAEACCNISGVCDAYPNSVGISNCIHCGGEMFEEDGFWWHHTQRDIPVEERGTVHNMISHALEKTRN